MFALHFIVPLRNLLVRKKNDNLAESSAVFLKEQWLPFLHGGRVMTAFLLRFRGLGGDWQIARAVELVLFSIKGHAAPSV